MQSVGKCAFTTGAKGDIVELKGPGHGHGDSVEGRFKAPVWRAQDGVGPRRWEGGWTRRKPPGQAGTRPRRKAPGLARGERAKPAGAGEDEDGAMSEVFHLT